MAPTLGLQIQSTMAIFYISSGVPISAPRVCTAALYPQNHLPSLKEGFKAESSALDRLNQKDWELHVGQADFKPAWAVPGPKKGSKRKTRVAKTK